MHRVGKRCSLFVSNDHLDTYLSRRAYTLSAMVQPTGIHHFSIASTICRIPRQATGWIGYFIGAIGTFLGGFLGDQLSDRTGENVGTFGFLRLH